MKQQFKYYKSENIYYQVGNQRYILVCADKDFPDILGNLSENFPDFKYDPATMQEFEEAYLWTRHQLDKQALQSRKMKEVQS